MLSPQLRRKVHDLWSLFWSSGLSNPLVAIEQITYLLFIRQLESLDRERVKQRKQSIYDFTEKELNTYRKSHRLDEGSDLAKHDRKEIAIIPFASTHHPGKTSAGNTGTGVPFNDVSFSASHSALRNA